MALQNNTPCVTMLLNKTTMLYEVINYGKNNWIQ